MADKIQKLMIAVVSIIVANVFLYWNGINSGRENILLFILIFFAVYRICPQIMKEEKKVNFLVGILSLGWSVSVIIGNKSVTDDFTFFIVCEILIMSIAVFVVFFEIIQLMKKVKPTELHSHTFNKKLWMIFALLFLLCWIPVYLCYFPGCLSSDSLDITQQAMGITKINNHHPIMYTLLLRMCILVGERLGGVTAGIAIFSLLQMIIQATILAYCVEKIRSYGCNYIVLGGSLIFFSCSFIIAFYSITLWKDVLFSCWILLLVLFLFEKLCTEKNNFKFKKRDMLSIVILSFLIAFGKNNGIYIIILTGIVVCFYFRKHYKMLVPVFLSTIIAILFIQGPVYNMLQIRHGNFCESVAIPLQQIGYTVKYNGEITNEQSEFLDQLIPLDKMKEAYVENTSDGIKFNENFNNTFLEDNKMEFFKVWVGMFVNNPVAYVKAFLLETMGYWHINTVGYTCELGTADAIWNALGVNNCNIFQKLTGIDLTGVLSEKLPMFWSNTPVLNLLTSPSFAFWMIVLCIIMLIQKKQYRFLISLIPLIGLWGTIMIAAHSHAQFRYVYALYISIPYVFFLACSIPEYRTEIEETNTVVEQMDK